MKQKDARFLPPVVQQEIRHKAIELFLKGFSQIHISTTLGVSTRSIYNWIKAYKESGEKGLKLNTLPFKSYPRKKRQQFIGVMKWVYDPITALERHMD